MNKKLFEIVKLWWFCVLQVAMAWVFTVYQTFGFFEDVRGITITWLLFADIFVILNFFLTMGTYRNLKVQEKERRVEVRKNLIVYGNWVICITPMVVISLFKCDLVEKDYIVSIAIVISAVLLIVWAKLKHLSIATDPVVRGLLVGLFRVVPHLYMFTCIVHQHGSGIPPETVFAANVTAIARIISLSVQGCKTGFNKNTKASLWSEGANEGSWLAVTAIWLHYH